MDLQNHGVINRWVYALVIITVLGTSASALGGDEPATHTVNIEEPDTDQAVAAAEDVELGANDSSESDEMTDEELLELFRIFIEEHQDGPQVEVDHMDLIEHETMPNEVDLDYYGQQTTEEGIAEEIGGVVGAFIAIVDHGLEASLWAGILTPLDEYAGTYYVEHEWVEEYHDDEITMEELMERVLGTLESE